MSIKRSRGVQQSDVNGAADELLSEQLKPTIERVRMKLGRGSPNTVGPMLDVWFSSLGARLGATEAEWDEKNDIPAPVQMAMKTLWNSACLEAHNAFDTAKTEFAHTVKQHEQRLAEALFELSTERETFAQQASDQRQAMEALNVTLALTKAQAEQLQMQLMKKDDELTSLRQTLQQQVAEGLTERRRHDEQTLAHRTEIQALQTQFANSDRRMLMEIDRERQLVKKLQTELDLEKKSLKQHQVQAQEMVANLTRQLHELKLENTQLSERANADVVRLQVRKIQKFKPIFKKNRHSV